MKRQLLSKRWLVSLLFTLVATSSWAYDAVIDGIYYNFLNKSKTAVVTNGGSNVKYSGDVVIPSSVTYENIVYDVTSIGDNAFRNNYGLKSITIPNSITKIGDYAFNYCLGLTSIIFPNSVTSIGRNAFEHCSNLTEIKFGSGITSIGDNAFYDSRKISKVEYYSIESLCKISFGMYASNPLQYAKHLYYNGREVKDLIIPSGVTSIGQSAFINCSYLTSVIIPNSVTSIGDNSFCGCSSLTSINIPNSVTSIGYGAFNDCSGLVSVTIPNNLTSIYESTFGHCSGLTSIIIPNSVTSIGQNAFYFCSNLKSIVIPNGVKNIGHWTFYNCSKLEVVSIPESVTSINNEAFSKCNELSDVYCYSKNVPSTTDDIFADSYIEYATLHVPESSLNSYKTISPWSGFGTILPIDPTGVNETKGNVKHQQQTDGKYTMNGKIYIVKNGLKYNIDGTLGNTEN